MLIPYQEKECLLREIWKIFLLPSLSTSLQIRTSWKIYISVQTALLRRLPFIPPCLRNFATFFSWSYEEMPGIDPSIVEYEIRTYPDAKPIRQKLRPVNSRKAATVKAEVEKLLKASFIYPIALTEWVSNPVPIDKKQGTIRICTNFRYLNKACPNTTTF